MIRRPTRRTARVAKPLVETRPLCSGGPLLFTPSEDGVDLCAWVRNRRDEVTDHLHRHGSLLFRGFGVDHIEALTAFIQACTDEPLQEYTYRSTPRTQLKDRVYTSTEYPADQHIPMHNEAAYADVFPAKLWFCCAIAAAAGGETPIVDSRAVYAALPPELRGPFEAKGVRYVRNYGPLDLPWPEVFGTDDRDQVDAYCRAHGMTAEWLGEEGLRTVQTCQAVMRHPVTDEPVWFNQAHLFHSGSLPEDVRHTLRSERAEEAFPRNAFYGDGSIIPDEVTAAIRATYDRLAVAELWQKGDVLYVDNLLAAHGRRPFSGERRVLVGMTGALRGDFQTVGGVA